jgi:GSCFA family
MPTSSQTPAMTPYSNLPPQAFWRSGVAEAGPFGLSALWSSKWNLPTDARFSTYGSCFAQHISRAMVARNVRWVNAEPAPGRTPPKVVETFNYGVFSSRTGNIYTAAQLLMLVRLAAGLDDSDAIENWPDGAGFRCSIRPAIEPHPFLTRDDTRMSRAATARAFRRSIIDAEVFIFTLGLTESWENAATGQVYPVCPGTIAGQFDPKVHVFRNYDYRRVRADLDAAFELIWALNPALRILLTVSPVPLTATASGGHVLVSTTYSKSTLRAVAGDMAASDARIDYFPSYEIITGVSPRRIFFEPNLRSVTKKGVDVVMGHFFAGLVLGAPAERTQTAPEEQRAAKVAQEMAADDLVCEEMILEKFNDN